LIGRAVPFLLAVGLLVAGAPSARAAVPSGGPAPTASRPSDERLRQFMAQVRPQPTASQAGGSAVRAAAAVSPERLQERADLLKSGEAALARLDLDTALRAFEGAALILHAADTEIALVRRYMQGGEYRRALAFGAHTAGAHLDVVGGSALYAWLLHVGGQRAVAQRLLAEAAARMPGNPVVGAVQQQLGTEAPLATGPLLAPPTRLAPYGASTGVPASARIVGTGLLLRSGRHALVPLSLMPRSGGLWLRNGLGQLARARLDRPLPALGVALVQLDSALPVPDVLWVASRDAFPGSVGFAVEYVSAPDASPAWPVLHSGFVGGVAQDTGAGTPIRLLGIDLPPGPHGGPVFDAAGRLTGLALQGQRGTPDRLVPVSQLNQAIRVARGSGTVNALGLPPPHDTGARPAMDLVYETSLKVTLQVIRAP
jgi:hypothetical protein